MKLPGGKFWRKFHLFMGCVWISLLIPTVFLWNDSVLWVAIMSWWANVESSFAAYSALCAKQAAEKTNGQDDSPSHVLSERAPPNADTPRVPPLLDRRPDAAEV